MTKNRRNVALVTGVGRRQGIGYALCELFSKNGFDIFYTYWKPYDVAVGLIGNEDDPNSFVSLFEQNGIKAECIEIDLRLSTAPSELFTHVVEKMGIPSVLVNNACVSVNQDFFDIKSDALDEHYAVNVKATTLLCKEFASASKSGGVIINMTSGQSLGVMENELLYTITKASVDMLTKQLASLLLQKHIRIYAVDPGPTDTGWMNDEVKTVVRSESSTGEITTPLQVAEAVLLCITDGTQKASGSIFHLPR